MKIGILQTGRSPEPLVDEFGEYGEMFAKMLGGRGLSFRTYDVLEHDFPASVDVMDGWLITGSKFGAYEDHDWIPPLEELVRAVFKAGLPLIGVCFGHQVIAQALGGRVAKYDGGWSVGRVEYQTIEGNTLPLHAWHQDQVITPPTGARTLASTDFCKHAILAYGSNILTMQPHPEFDSGFIAGLANSRGRGVVPDALLDEAIASLGKEVAKSTVADSFEKHFKTNYKGGENHG
ncbi:MAG: type 1 glutamine amidotransferase [Rhodobacteraceae bacterium]|nr:type 1 glutamine amidotransferase [Paracoccaceae bacterium]